MRDKDDSKTLHLFDPLDLRTGGGLRAAFGYLRDVPHIEAALFAARGALYEDFDARR